MSKRGLVQELVLLGASFALVYTVQHPEALAQLKPTLLRHTIDTLHTTARIVGTVALRLEKAYAGTVA